MCVFFFLCKYPEDYGKHEGKKKEKCSKCLITIAL